MKSWILSLFIPCAVLAQPVQVAWINHYDGSAGGPDAAEQVAVDAAGNVYVAGWSNGLSTGEDITTVKYDPSGNQLWAALYDGPVSGNDRAQALAVDASGNVYVTGSAKVGSIASRVDYATLKYDPHGNLLWAVLFDGGLNSIDSPEALALDASGNVLVTGRSIGRGTNYDFATVKYDTHGNLVWVARYHGGTGADYASSLAIDSSGNVHVTGQSQGAGTGFDYATVKYDASGNQLWAARSDGPSSLNDQANALALDSSGNVFVTGYVTLSTTSPQDQDYLTIKYDPAGNRLWAAQYNGIGAFNSRDRAWALAVTSLGEVIVTGGSDGQNTDYTTVKYDAQGNQIWVARYNGGASADDARAVVVDASNNAYVTGSSIGSGTGRDIATIKYDPNGQTVWVERLNGPQNGHDYGVSLVLDSGGSVLVAGYIDFIFNTSGQNFTTIKYAQVLNRPPVAQCRDVTVSTGPNDGACSLPVSIDHGSFDPDGDAITLTQDPPGPYTVGATTVTLTATDPDGASASCTATVTVIDNTPPLILCPANVTVANDPGQCSAVVSFQIGTFDNCGTAQVSSAPASGSSFPTGTTTVTAIARDAAGSTAQCTFTVTVEDREAPVAACVSGVNPSGRNRPDNDDEDDDNPSGFFELLATDNCDGLNAAIFIMDSASDFVAGPFLNGDVVKITHLGRGDDDEDEEDEDRPKPRVRFFKRGAVKAHIKLLGDGLLTAIDRTGNASAPILCSMPAAPEEDEEDEEDEDEEDEERGKRNKVKKEKGADQDD